MKSSPPSKSLSPKVKRLSALNRSVPMLVSHMPTSVASAALSIELPASSTTSDRPSTIMAKNSGELNDSATSASTGDKKVRMTMPMVPAMKEAMAAMASAGPARPFLAIW